jgi:hypothetical protein
MPPDTHAGCRSVDFKRPAKVHSKKGAAVPADPAKQEARKKWIEQLQADLKVVDELWKQMPPDDINEEIMDQINVAFTAFDVTLENCPA